jgi:hypothetical protein
MSTIVNNALFAQGANNVELESAIQKMVQTAKDRAHGSGPRVENGVCIEIKPGTMTLSDEGRVLGTLVYTYQNGDVVEFENYMVERFAPVGLDVKTKFDVVPVSIQKPDAAMLQILSGGKIKITSIKPCTGWGSRIDMSEADFIWRETGYKRKEAAVFNEWVNA